MKNWSIKKQMYFLSAALMSLTVIASVTGFFDAYMLSKRLDEVSHVIIPSVRAIGMADMMHDNLRSIVYRALFLADGNDEMAKREVRLEFKEAAERFQSELGTITNLKMAPQVVDQVAVVQPDVKRYMEVCDEAISLALGGHKSAAISKLADVQTAFEALEKSLDKLGDLVESYSDENVKAGEKFSLIMVWLCGGLVLFGLVFGTLLAFAVVRNLMNTLGSVISQLDRSSQTLTSSSTESSQSATELSEASAEQAASLQETMASVEEISAMVTQNAESAGKVTAVVAANEQASDDGSQSVGDMLRAINEIKETNDKILSQMETSNAEFGEIVKIISEIGDKTKVINDIVFQTKLLSFNASVEAARAGEHGKGFAVVAEEVGNLAQMSGNAAKQISDMLSDSIKKVNGIVEQTTHRVDQLVEIGKDKITMGQSTAQKCKDALDRISQNAHTVSAMVSEITNASKEQAQGIQEITKAISQLDQATQQNAGVAQQTSTQADHLNKEAAVLAEAVTRLVRFVGREASAQEVENDDAGNVIPMNRRRHRKDRANAHSASPSGRKVKRASGGDVVPDGNDPGFEEF